MHGDGHRSVRKTLDNNDIGALVVIGGDRTLQTALKLADDGVRVIDMPETIDDDIAATDVTFGFDTAVQIASEAIDRLTTTAEAHNRSSKDVLWVKSLQCVRLAGTLQRRRSSAGCTLFSNPPPTAPGHGVGRRRERRCGPLLPRSRVPPRLAPGLVPLRRRERPSSEPSGDRTPSPRPRRRAVLLGGPTPPERRSARCFCLPGRDTVRQSHEIRRKPLRPHS